MNVLTAKQKPFFQFVKPVTKRPRKDFFVISAEQ